MKKLPKQTSLKKHALQEGWRFYGLFGVLLLGMLGLVFRMAHLSIFDRSFLMGQSESRVVRLVDIPSYRGMILDRNNVPLAVSAPVDSIWVNPQILKLNPNQLSALAQILHLTLPELKQKINPNSEREFVYLARTVPPDIADRIKALKIFGIFFQREYRRFYPSGDISAHVLGFTNIDDNGQEGLELAYNDWLKGVPGKRQVVKDRLGETVANLGVVRSPQEGHDLTLSIDSRIQYLAYTSLQQALPKYNAESGSIVVLNVQTGEILGMANLPCFNPNARIGHNLNAYRNRAATDMFEPGSTMKSFSIASALASGRYKAESTVNTNPGYMTVDKFTIRDHDGNNGVINLKQVLEKSSNVGAAKITLSLPSEDLWRILHIMGFGASTESGFPGESPGMLIKEHFHHPANLATMSYGYGLSATLLQLTRAYAIFAAHGVKREVSFIKADQQEIPAGEQVIPQKLADEMLSLLEATADAKSGAKAQIPGYRIGGKTGTAYTASHGGYKKDYYNSSFIGIAPLSNPQLVVAVVLHGVHGGQHYGAQVSAPIFETVMEGALRYLNIPPDDLKN